jgi:hypothetical protein
MKDRCGKTAAVFLIKGLSDFADTPLRAAKKILT